ncbi:calcium-binding protein [Ruegeria sp. WL0004]|uniref:Calcium-binding protein n=1 Tax=Ruegeria marisflavi TaxID=2984152 RepID=A0ABT2WMT0_9RHOB|nr:calcium-binding protein [Ruegeria sp. WL0004]
MLVTNGTTGNDNITTGVEDDVINTFGGTDIISSGAGDDTVNPGDNNEFDYTDTGTGNDLLILSDATSGFQALGFDSLTNGVTVTIDGTANTGTIDKAASGTTTITDVRTAMLADGFGVFGSNHNDTFTVTAVEGGFAMMRGLGGNDTFNIVSGPGTVRLDYRASSVTTGIVADLATGIVSEDGFGGTDTILGDPLDQIRGTDLGDTISGSAGDDDIRSEGGNDLLSDGLGNDVIRAGDGNDTINATGGGDDAYNEYWSGIGDDVIDLSAVAGGSVALAHFDLNAGIQVSIDGGANTGSIVKSSGGTTTLTDARNAMLVDQLIIYGTAHDDTFTVSTVEGGFASIRGYQGNDTFNIVSGPGTVRLDYRSNTVTTGIIANLGTGIVSEDGFGGTDTILGDPLDQIRGTDLGDTITGSAGDDDIRSEDGNDLISDGLGSDRIRSGDGNDTINAGGGTGDAFDEINAGTGDDLIDFSAVTDGNIGVAHFDLSMGIQATIDGVANTGTIVKASGGTTTLTDVQNAMENSWFQLFGTFQNDTLTASAAEGGNIVLRGYGGDDRLVVQDSPGRVRLDYDSSSASTGVIADLGTGIVSEDGFGGTDTIVGTGYFEFRGGRLNDSITGSERGERVRLRDGDDFFDGAGGEDQAQYSGVSSDATITQLASGDIQVVSSEGTDILRNVEVIGFDDRELLVADLFPVGSEPITGTPEADALNGTAGDDTILGLDGNDRLIGDTGNDSMDGGLGADTLNGGDGDDIIIGGPGADDLRDIVYAGEGNDSVDAGAGNDLVYGQGGNDTIAGGFGVDEIQGQDGDDVITGSAFSDLVFGGAGSDFVNGGFGHDRINGGSGADKFYHLGIFDHGSDWVQDYNAAEGDVLLFGNAAATRADFQVNFNHTASAEGERAGDDAVQEAFVIYRPTGQIMWALVDGQGQSSINLQIGGDVFDLLT